MRLFNPADALLAGPVLALIVALLWPTKPKQAPEPWWAPEELEDE